MNYNVGRIVNDKSFSISGTSYIGNPVSNTAMFITKKVENLICTLNNVTECLVFAENGIVVSEEIGNKHAFTFSDKPQLEYAKFANQFAEERFLEEKKLEFIQTPQGYFVCEDVYIPEDAYIEPGCVIGPDVVIGKCAKIFANSVIRRAKIGDNFIANEHSVIGSNGFTMVDDENGNKMRIPTLGKVIIGNNVEIGAFDNISCGSGGNTIIDDYVKLDVHIHIGHDAHLNKNVEITAGSIIGGFDVIDEGVFIGLNSSLRNRINVGANTLIGMGSVVTKSIEKNKTVVGNPARIFVK